MNEQSPLHHYLRVLRRQAWVIVLCTATAVAVAAAATAAATPVHRASMAIVVGQGGGVLQPEFGGNVEPFTLTMSNLLRRNVVAERVIQNLRLEETPQELLANVRVSSRPASSVLDVSYDSTNKQKAEAVLAEVGRVFDQLVRERLGEGGGQSGGATGTGATQITARVWDEAHLEPGQVSPKLSRNLAFAGALGLALGLVIAFVREALDDRVRRRKDAAEWFGAPVIGTLPSGQRGKPLAASFSGRHRRERLESLQLLTARLQFGRSEVNRPVIVVTSGQDGEGKTIAVANIGLALAAAGKDVICVDADLYRPRLHEYLGLPDDRPGLADVLDRRAELRNALQDVPLGPLSAESDGAGDRGWLSAKPNEPSESRPDALSSAWGRLRAVTAGRRDASQPEPLDELGLTVLLEDLRSRADYVVFDTPPVLLVGDAFPLLVAAESVIVVARRGWTKKGAAEAVRMTLDGLGIDQPSVILTDSDEPEAFRYGGGYFRSPGTPRSSENSPVA